MNIRFVKYACLYIAAGAAGAFIGSKIADLLLGPSDDMKFDGGYRDDDPTPEPEPDPINEVDEVSDLPDGESIPDDAIVVQGTILRPTDIFTIEQNGDSAKVKKQKKSAEPQTDYTKFLIPNAQVEKARLSDLARKYRPQETDVEGVTDPSKPFIISFEEYLENTAEKHTLTYYEGDDTLCDQGENVIPDEDIEGLIGPDALIKFGTRSDDPHIVYVRNMKNGVDYEVVRNLGSYKLLVAGMREDVQEEGRIERRRKGRQKNGEEK